jgi:hypothetical protein
MTAMDQDPLLHLLDHPPGDADAPRDPVLTRQVMERVQRVHTARASASAGRRPWYLAAAFLAAATLLVLVAPTSGLLSDGGLDEAAGLFDRGALLEVAAGALVAGAALALARRRTV